MIFSMDRRDLRLHNARRLVEEAGGPSGFAKKLGMSDSQASQVVGSNPTRGIGNGLAPRIEKAFGKPTGWLDMEHDAVESTAAALASLSPHSNIIAFAPGDELPEGTVLVPVYRVRFAAGAGQECDFIEEGEPVAYQIAWFRQIGIHPKYAKRVKVAGDSMEPLLFEGDSVLVDTADNDPANIIDGKVYAIRYGGQLRIKRLSRRLDGTLVLDSENKKYKQEEIPPEIANESITLIGRVRDRSGSGGL